MTDAETLMRKVYAAFNAREIDAVLAALHPEVDWANGMDGGHVHGLDAVRAYWTRQWTMIDPRVEPVRVDEANGVVTVEVRQTIRDLNGELLSEGMVRHLYRLEDGLVRRMDIRKD
jgi:hypothetical protein